MLSLRDCGGDLVQRPHDRIARVFCLEDWTTNHNTVGTGLDGLLWSHHTGGVLIIPIDDYTGWTNCRSVEQEPISESITEHSSLCRRTDESIDSGLICNLSKPHDSLLDRTTENCLGIGLFETRQNRNPEHFRVGEFSFEFPHSGNSRDTRHRQKIWLRLTKECAISRECLADIEGLEVREDPQTTRLDFADETVTESS